MESIFVYLTELSGGAAYFIIFGILVACGLGFPLPEDIPLIAAGYLIWNKTLSWVPAISITMLGVLFGDSILFFIGRKLGLKMLDNPRLQTFLKPEKVRRTRAYFRKYGDKIVFFARFVAGFRAAAFFMAGAMKMKYTRFAFLDGMAALISVPVWIWIGERLGYFFGDKIEEIFKRMEHMKNAVSIVVLVIVVVVVARAYVKYKKAKKATQARRAAVRKPALRS